MTDDPTVRYDIENGVATLTLNRPQALNAVTLDMEDLLHDHLRQADAHPDVRCIVITGEGRGFCAGDDVKAGWGDPRMAESLARMASPQVRLSPHAEILLHVTTPTIAAVNGVAVGFGMDLALLCDIRVAAASARFGQLFVRMGLIPDIAGLWLLPQLVGPSAAAELVLTGDTIGAEEALRLGVVSKVVPDEDLPGAVRSLADRIAANPPLAVAAVKEGLRRAAGRSVSELPDLAAVLGARLHALFATADHKEAVQAFVERRAATFHGR